MSPAVDVAGYRANLIRAIPLALAIPVAIGLVIVLSGVPFDPVAFGVGAGGWLVALMLRAPVALLAMRASGGDRSRAEPIIVAASGPAEELVRLVVILLVGRTLPGALWIGLGWGAIEVVYAILSGAAMLALMGRTDPEAEQARALIPMPDAMRADAPLWGVVERAWATLLHIGFTVIIAALPLLVVGVIVAHSATNLVLLRWGGGLGLARFQAAGIAWTAAVLTAAWLTWAALAPTISS